MRGKVVKLKKNDEKNHNLKNGGENPLNMRKQREKSLNLKIC